MTLLHTGTLDQPAEAGRPRPGEPLLEVTGLCVDYGIGPNAVRAVSDADLVLHRGEVLGLAGESGSGKSTFAYAVTRLLRAPAGPEPGGAPGPGGPAAGHGRYYRRPAARLPA